MIRSAERHDLREILAIYNDAILTTTAVYDYHPKTIADRQAWYEDKQQAGYPLLVYTIGQDIAAFATFGPFRDWPAYKYTIEHSIYVHKKYRRQGIAAALLAELIKLADSQGYATIVAGIDSENTASIILHKKFGFMPAGTIKNAGFKFNKWLDLTFYQLKLTGPTNPVED